MFLRQACAAIVLCTAVAWAEPPLQVTWKAPRGWTLLDHSRPGSDVVAKFTIEGTKVGTGLKSGPCASIRVFAPTTTEARDDTYDGAAILGDVPATLVAVGTDGNEWRTYLFASNRLGGPTIEAVRHAVIRGTEVDVVVSFPLIVLDKNEKFAMLTLEPSTTVGDQTAGLFLHPASAWELMDSFNAICESLKVNGTSSCRAKLFLAEVPEGSSFYTPAESGKPKH